MKRLFTLFTAIATLCAFGQTENNFKIKEEKSTRTWEEYETEIEFGFKAGLSPHGERSVEFSFDRQQPIKGQVPLVFSSKFGYINNLTMTTGFGAAFGRENIYFAPQLLIGLGNKTGLGYKWRFHAHDFKRKIFFTLENEYLIDFIHKRDVLYGLAELSIRPKPLFEFGLDFRNILNLERIGMIYQHSHEYEAEAGMFIRFNTPYGFIKAMGNIQPLKFRESEIKVHEASLVIISVGCIIPYTRRE
jgi:hypothetical protein